LALGAVEKRGLIEWDSEKMSVARQCRLVGLARSTLYHEGQGESAENLALMRLIDEQYMAQPDYGEPRMTRWLRANGHGANHKRVARLMRTMGLQSVLPRRRTSVPCPGHKVYPYLLRGLAIERPNQVWCADITYIPMWRGFAYLVAVMDWYSRYVLSWAVSVTMDSGFCVEALERALRLATPEMSNTDQGSQFTCGDYTGLLERHGVRISMDGRGRAFDNIMIERLWWSVKYEHVYVREPPTVPVLVDGIGRYFTYYNTRRQHQALDYRTPAQMYFNTSARQLT
jgi:putative transposase